MGFYGRRMVPEPLLKLLKKLDDAGVTEEDLAALAGLAEDLGDINTALEGKQAEITEDNKLLSDLVNDTEQDNKFVTEAEKTIWSNKQGKLYLHNIIVNGMDDMYVNIQIVNDSNTPINTTALLGNYLNTNGFTSAGHFYNANGTISQDDGYIVHGVFYYNNDVKIVSTNLANGVRNTTLYLDAAAVETDIVISL